MLLALLLENDAHHIRAQRLLETVDEPVAVPYGVLLESCWVLQRSTRNFGFVADSARHLFERFAVVFEDGLLAKNAVSRYSRRHDSLSLVDCELVEWKKTAGFDVLTFDAELERELAGA